MFMNFNNFMALLNYLLFIIFMLVNFWALHRKLDRIEDYNVMVSILIKNMSDKEY